ncbi:MAG: general stress protein [Gemmatimonadales bacterium]
MTSPNPGGDLPPTESDPPDLTVVGLFASRSEAEAAVRDLKGAGFTDQQIGLAMQDSAGRRDSEEEPSPSEPATRGAVGGGLAGGLIGLLGSLLVPGVGPVVLGGVLATSLTGAGIGAAAGGLIGLLRGMGVSESDAEHFDRGLRAGGILLTVSAGGRTPQALAILKQHRPDLGLDGGAAAAGRSSVAPNRRNGENPGYPGPERRFMGV